MDVADLKNVIMDTGFTSPDISPVEMPGLRHARQANYEVFSYTLNKKFNPQRQCVKTAFQ